MSTSTQKNKRDQRARKVAAYRARRLQLVTQIAYVAQLPESETVKHQVATMQRELRIMAARHAMSIAAHLRPSPRRGEIASRTLENLNKLRRHA